MVNESKYYLFDHPQMQKSAYLIYHNKIGLIAGPSV